MNCKIKSNISQKTIEKHKKCSHLNQKIITHFNSFITNKKQYISNYIIASNDGNVQIGKNKIQQMLLQANMTIESFDKQALIIGSFYNPFSQNIFIWDQKSTIYSINYTNIFSSQRFQVKLHLQNKSILGMFSWMYKNQIFLFLIHQKGIQILSQAKNQIIKSIKTNSLILKGVNKNIISSFDTENKPNNYLVAALVFDNLRYPFVLTKHYVQSMISQSMNDNIIEQLLQWSQKAYLDDQKYQINNLTCLSMSDQYLVSGHNNGQIFIFNITQNQTFKDEICLQHIRTITQGRKIQSCHIDELTQSVAVSSDQAIMIFDIKKVQKIGNRLKQKKNDMKKEKNLNVVKWTYMGRLFLAQENFEKQGSLYLYNTDIFIERK